MTTPSEPGSGETGPRGGTHMGLGEGQVTGNPGVVKASVKASGGQGMTGNAGGGFLGLLQVLQPNPLAWRQFSEPEGTPETLQWGCQEQQRRNKLPKATQERQK